MIGKKSVAASPAVVAEQQPAAASVASSGKPRSDFESSITTIAPLRHGYYRLQLADGSAYETTATGAPPPAGAAVHVRRTLFGTTFLDIAGISPIAIRLSRQP